MKHQLVMTARNWADAWMFWVEDTNLIRPKKGWRSGPATVLGYPGRLVFTEVHGAKHWYMYVDTNPLNSGPDDPSEFIGWVKLDDLEHMLFVSEAHDPIISRMPKANP